MAATHKKRYIFTLITLVLFLATASLSCRKAVSPRAGATATVAAAYLEMIVYTSAGSLYSTDLAGNPAEKLTGSTGNDWFPAVSPDDSQIAFWSTVGGAYEIWSMDLRSEQRLQLTFFNEISPAADSQNFNIHNAPAWSPDNRRIAFSFSGKIWLMENTGFNLETIITEGENISPAWSPDGTRLAYVSNQGKTHNLHLFKLGTSENWAITNFPTAQHVGGPVWSPDGKQIAFTVCSREDTDIWIVQADGGKLTRLTQDKHSHSPAWSPDGKRIAFSSGRQDPMHWEIWVMNADGSGAFSVTRNGGVSPAWLRVYKTKTPRVYIPNTPQPTPEISSARLSPKPVAIEKKSAAHTKQPVKIETPVIIPTATFIPTSKPTLEPEPTAQPAPREKARVEPTTVVIPAQPTPREEVEPTAVPTLVPTPVPTVKKVEVPPTAVPTQEKPKKKEENYAEYEQYAEADRNVLPDLDIVEDKQGHRIDYLPKIDFYFAKDLIKPNSFPLLSRLAEELGKYPEAPLVVQGQPSGPSLLRAFLGKSLSRARANSVLRHLIVTEKIKQINVNAIGEGDEFLDLGKREDNQPVLLIIIK
jgi:outer membrane protein OmpA-like peptidoglycan-associated protein